MLRQSRVTAGRAFIDRADSSFALGLEIDDIPHTRNPDMVAFTIGRVALGLMASGSAIGMDAIHERLTHIVEHGSSDGVTPEMAEGALSEIASPKSAAT